MRFCPKCGALLIPKKEGSEEVLKCPKCGYEEVMKKDAKKDYMMSTVANRSQKVKTTSLVSEGGRRIRTKEEYEQEKEEYYEVFLELMREEEGTEGEGSSE